MKKHYILTENERSLINDFINAVSIKEVDSLVFQYSDMLDENPRLWTFARGARKRIHNLRREIKKSYSLQLN